MTTKAVRATITLGDIELDVFQLPNTEYRLSKKQTCEVIGLDRKRLSELLEKNSLKAIAGKGSSLSQQVISIATVELANKGSNAKVDLIPVEMSVLIWLESGSELGKQLAFASVLESIERRADSVFGLKRTEEERNNWFKIRMEDSKVFRRSLTDAMQDREALTGEKAPYGLATLSIYKRCAIYDKYQKSKDQGYTNFKSSLTLGELEELRGCEEMIAQFMRKKKIDVMSAIELYKSLFD